MFGLLLTIAMKPLILESMQAGPQEHSGSLQWTGLLLAFLLLFQRSDSLSFSGGGGQLSESDGSYSVS